MLPEVKGQLMKRQERLGELVERKKANIAECDVVLERFIMKSSSVKSQVTKTIQVAVDRLREKGTELLEKLDVQTDQQTEKLRSNMKSKQTETEIYSHQSEFIQQVLEIEDEAQLLDPYLSSRSETEANITEAQRKDTIVAFDIIFLHDLNKLKDEIGKIDVRSVTNTTATPDLTATPVLHEVIDAELGEHNSCGVRDAVVIAGDIEFNYAPEGMRALRDLNGITSTGKGEIIVADFHSHKVIHLSESGEFLRDIFTEEDGVKYPFGLWVDEDQLCVTVRNTGLHKYKFVNH